MKRFILLCLLAGTIWPAQGQTSSEQSLVLQQCFDLPQLQSYYPKDASGHIRQLVIMNHGVAFDVNLSATKDGMAPMILGKNDMVGGQADAYFLFNELTIGQSKARVVFAYYYAPQYLVSVSVNLDRSALGWTVLDAKLQERHEN